LPKKLLDFKGLSEALLARSREFIPQWLPGGKLIGREWTCASLRGGPGESCKANFETGKWSDFAGDERGGDLVSLYAAIQNITQAAAAKQLAAQIGFQLSPAEEPAKQPPKEHQITAPPDGVIVPPMVHVRHGQPVATWPYRDSAGKPIFYVARYDTPTGKEFSPWAWSASVGRWVQKGFPSPRPLYGLELLAERPDAAVLLVEGEKAADAARKIAGHVYVVVTWPNGAKAWDKADWAPLHGRKILIWPDADKPGLEAIKAIGRILSPHCPELKLIDTNGQPEGWDAADAVADGWTWPSFRDWAKPRASVFAQATAVVERGGNTLAAAQANVHVTVNTGDDQDSSPSLYALYDQLALASNNNGTPYINVDNAMRVIDRHQDLTGRIWYDVFHRKYFTTWGGPFREWGDKDSIALAEFMQREIGLHKMSDDIVYKAVILYGHRNSKNAPLDWMSTLTWDGKERIEPFFIDCFGAEDTPYTRAVGRNFWISMVARIHEPGCKVDNMVVLEGAQGTFKSTALDIIGRSWYAEAHESVTNKDFFMVLHGKMIIEIAELDSFSRAEVTRIKQVITCRTDRYRAPYGRVAEDHPRMSIFVGTTNETNYLRDSTGGRRFWPIKCRDINKEMIRTDREQFFAEAVAKFKRGDTWYEMPKDETEKEQKERRQADEWEGAIYDYLLGKGEVMVRDIATDCLHIDLGKLDVGVQRRIGAVLTTLGWKSSKEWNGGSQRRVWRKADAQEELVPF